MQDLLPAYRNAKSARKNEDRVKRRGINGWNYKNEKDFLKVFLNKIE
jgi:hypothetical protein